MADIRNTFVPIRITGRNGLATTEEVSRIEDLIKNALGQMAGDVNKVFNQLFISIGPGNVTNVAAGSPSAPGRQGDDGEDGQPGTPGAAGARGLDGARGAPGQDGDDGEAGVPGVPGATGAAGSIGATGSPGRPGIDGDDGADSFVPGPTGATGATGSIGATGSPGRPGIDGDDGLDSIMPGPAGAIGPPGPATTGARGAPGEDGEDAMPGYPGGMSPAMAQVWVSTPDPSLPFGVNMGALGTGPLQQSVTAGVATPSVFAWPLANRVMVSSGTSTIPVGNSAFQFDTSAARTLYMGAGSSQSWSNLNDLGAANYERITATWAANIWTLTSEAGGTGTVRAMTINAATSTLTAKGNSVDVSGATGVQVGLLAGVRSTPAVTIGGSTSVVIGAGATGPNPAASFAANQLVLDSSVGFTAGTWAGAVLWDGIKVTGGATLPGAGTNTADFASTKFAIPTITGSGVGATVNEAATVAIAGGPLASAISINLKMALWVQADAARFDGDVIIPTTANGGVATAMTSLGPVGSHTTVQKWWKVKDVSGTDYYIPMF